MGRHKKSSAETQAAAAVEGDEELVSMATVKSLLAAQESMLKSFFESVVARINTRVDDLADTVASIKTSLEFSQRETKEFEPMSSKLVETEAGLGQVKDSLEYLENQSRRNNIRVAGIPKISWRIMAGRGEQGQRSHPVYFGYRCGH